VGEIVGVAAVEGPDRRSPPEPKEIGPDFAWAIIELAPDGILVSGDDGRILTVNRQIEELFGYRREALIGARVDDLLPARLRDVHEAHRAAYAAAPASRSMGIDLDLWGCRADGSEFPIEVSLSPAATAHGVATVVVVRDISDRRALERAARTADVLDQNERLAAVMHDRVVHHLFACGLTLASVLARNELDAMVTERLNDVIDELDVSVQEMRHVVFEGLRRKEHTASPPPAPVAQELVPWEVEIQGPLERETVPLDE